MYSLNQNTEFYENQFARYTIDSSILFIDFKPYVIIDITAAKQIVIDRIRIQNGRPFLVLCKIDGIFYTTKPARDHFSRLGSELIKAIAFVASSSFHENILSYYLASHFTTVPNNIFPVLQDGIKFLKSCPTQ